MNHQIFVECQGCGSTDAQLVFEPRYRGYRGRCQVCDGDWPES